MADMLNDALWNAFTDVAREITNEVQTGASS